MVHYFIQTLLGNEWNGIKLNQKDIGVISPYAEQCRRITEKCEANAMNDVTVGTAELFQGQERDVVIVSTVRTDNLGFVNDDRVNIYAMDYTDFQLKIIK